MAPHRRARAANAGALAAAAWLVASTFVLSMPLELRWFTRLSAFTVLTAAIYTTIQQVTLERTSTVVSALMALGGLWIAALGYLFSWPSMTVWVSSLVGGLLIAAGAGYNVYRNGAVDLPEGLQPSF